MKKGGITGIGITFYYGLSKLVWKGYEHFNSAH